MRYEMDKFLTTHMTPRNGHSICYVGSYNFTC